MKTRPENSRQPNRKSQSFFLRGVRIVPKSARPTVGIHMAYNTPLDCIASDAVVAAVVLIVSADVPEPPATELGLNEHMGGRVAVGVILLQVRVTAPVKPFVGAIVIVEVAVPPGEMEAGDRAVAATVKSAA